MKWFYYVKQHFQQSNNGVMQVIGVNVFCFIIFSLIKIVGFIVGYEGIYRLLYRQLYLSSFWMIFKSKPWTLLTYFFVHNNFAPMFWSLLTLYLFGNIIQNYLGSKHFIFVYFLGGIIGGVCFLLLCNLSPHLQNVNTHLVGPSAALYATMSCAATITPNFYINLLLLGKLPIKYVVVFFILVALASFVVQYEECVAQLGGAVVGYLYGKYRGGPFEINTTFNDFFRSYRSFKIIRHI